MGKLVLVGAKITDGRAAPAPGTLVVEDGVVAELRPATAIANATWSAEDRVVDLSGHLLVPGLIDAHTHLLMSGDGNYERELLRDGVPLRTLRAAAHARSAIDNGILTI